jgi:hypothetical protein
MAEPNVEIFSDRRQSWQNNCFIEDARLGHKVDASFHIVEHHVLLARDVGVAHTIM